MPAVSAIPQQPKRFLGKGPYLKVTHGKITGPMEVQPVRPFEGRSRQAESHEAEIAPQAISRGSASNDLFFSRAGAAQRPLALTRKGAGAVYSGLGKNVRLCAGAPEGIAAAAARRHEQDVGSQRRTRGYSSRGCLSAALRAYPNAATRPAWNPWHG